MTRYAAVASWTDPFSDRLAHSSDPLHSTPEEARGQLGQDWDLPGLVVAIGDDGTVTPVLSVAPDGTETRYAPASGAPEANGETVHYAGQADIARWFNVTGAAVAKWVNRYSDTPRPDVIVGSGHQAQRGWLPEREADWRAWKADRDARRKALERRLPTEVSDAMSVLASRLPIPEATREAARKIVTDWMAADPESGES